jgi:hypothetical protein
LSAPLTGVLRSTQVVVLARGASVTGLVMAANVSMLDGASVRGLVVARDSLRVAPGSSVTADFSAVFSALRDRARLRPTGRRGLLVFQ